MKEETIVEKITWEEYACITNRIMTAIQVKHAYNVAMYTITIAIIGFALESKNAWLFLLPYIVLFSFHRLIQNERYRINKYDAYLAVYSKDGWEQNYKTFHMNLEQCYNRHPHGITKSKMVRVSALHLGFMCSVMAILMGGYNIISIESGVDLNRWISNTTFFDWLLGLAAVVLFVVMIFWCKNANDSMYTRDKYIEQIKKLILMEEDDQKVSSNETMIENDLNKQEHVIKDDSVMKETVNFSVFMN